MNDVPDWLWQNIEEIAAVLAIIHYTIKAARWAKSRAMLDKPTLTAGAQAQILYNVEAPTPSHARS
jgi:hypothetical protein